MIKKSQIKENKKDFNDSQADLSRRSFEGAEASTFAKASVEDDERRLFYVALTRARKGITITYSKTGQNGREQLPSQFLSEIKKNLIEEINTSKFEKDFEEKKHLLFSQEARLSDAPEARLLDQEFVGEIFERQGLSVTALNNYLECPWNFFYSNLLRLPKAPNKHMIYGTAIHRALKDFFSQLKDREISKENLLESFEFYLNRQSLNDHDLKEVLEKGRKSLSGYYEEYYKIWERNVLTEFEIKGIDAGVGIHLNGNLDKIEFLGSSNEVNVVDYKTRQPLSRNEIEKRGYKRQLAFYKLLLDNLGKYKMISAEIDFIEPNDKKAYKKEKFIIEDSEVIELKDTITRVVDEILNLKFWDKNCDQKDCQYCILRSFVRS